MPPQETGKQRAVRIPLDYFKHPNRLERWKKRLLLGALVVSVGWPLSGFLVGARGNLKYARGEVAAVHATWENNCNACHVDFQPIRGDMWASGMLGGDHHAGSKQCQNCHEGPPHHAQQASNLACASCHRDHRGRTASMIRGFDGDCTQCHANPTTPLTPDSRSYEKVTRFDLVHPEFDSLRDRKRTLKFSHARHLALGMGIGKKLNYLEPAYRKRYGDAQAAVDDNVAIQLNCASCHRTDSADFQATRGQLADVPAAVLPARSAGEYMQPITYENQCRACHPLTIDPKVSSAPAVPHRLQLKEMRAFLKQAVIADMLDKKTPLWAEWLQAPRPFPGRGPSEDQKEKTEALREEVDTRVKKIETVLLSGHNTCGECHHYKTDENKPSVPLSVMPTGVPAVWFKHARFDHKAHRAVDCRECHAQAYETKADTDADWSDSVKVQIAGRDTCRKCHAPVGLGADGKKVGGARFDCAECHRYHQGDAWLEGPGSKARAPSNKRSLENFLSGTQGQ